MFRLYYLYLKLAAVFLRALTKLQWRIAARPDSIEFIPSRDPGRTIKAHYYQSPASECQKPRRLLINFHGSGFILPLHGSDDSFCRHISQQTEYSVLDVQYRLAPESPFPAAVNDVEDAIKWLLCQPQRFDSGSLAISGFSAGGNLALVACTHLFPPGTFRAALLFYPSTEYSLEPAELVAPDAGGNPLPTAVVRLFQRCYLQTPVDPMDPRISPGLADQGAFPANILIVTAGYDTLAPEAEKLAKKLQESPNRHVVAERMEKCDHAWDKLVKPWTREEQLRLRAYDLAVDMLRSEGNGHSDGVVPVAAGT
ncbi:Alpha/Beta hydrolase protein [Aspergillus pseudoustus]|uniref:Alpha/Beta hydrolase protein n=1 Tax=Aspergillus pseudoustus TaxID=1810923 RepID=A0ABR4JPS0_9EURO